jgi:hypothetical protein
MDMAQHQRLNKNLWFDIFLHPMDIQSSCVSNFSFFFWVGRVSINGTTLSLDYGSVAIQMHSHVSDQIWMTNSKTQLELPRHQFSFFLHQIFFVMPRTNFRSKYFTILSHILHSHCSFRIFLSLLTQARKTFHAKATPNIQNQIFCTKKWGNDLDHWNSKSRLTKNYNK